VLDDFGGDLLGGDEGLAGEFAGGVVGDAAGVLADGVGGAAAFEGGGEGVLEFGGVVGLDVAVAFDDAPGGAEGRVQVGAAVGGVEPVQELAGAQAGGAVVLAEEDQGVADAGDVGDGAAVVQSCRTRRPISLLVTGMPGAAGWSRPVTRSAKAGGRACRWAARVMPRMSLAREKSSSRPSRLRILSELVETCSRVPKPWPHSVQRRLRSRPAGSGRLSMTLVASLPHSGHCMTPSEPCPAIA
jgi:hypothetical protein